MLLEEDRVLAAEAQCGFGGGIERAVEVPELGRQLGQAVALAEGLVLLLAQSDDVLQLVGIANDDRPLRAIEQRQRGGDVALRGLINDDAVKELRHERQGIGDAEVGHDPDRAAPAEGVDGGLEAPQEVDEGATASAAGRAGELEVALRGPQRFRILDQALAPGPLEVLGERELQGGGSLGLTCEPLAQRGG